MWAIAHYKAYNSPWRNYPEEDKKKLCLSDIIKDINAKLPEDLLEAFEELQFDSERRYLTIWSKKVDEVANVLETTTVTIDNIKEIQDLLMKCDKLLDQKDAVIKRLQKKVGAEEKSSGNMSLLEQDAK